MVTLNPRALYLMAMTSLLTVAGNLSAASLGPDRRVRVEAVIDAPISEVWRLWTTSDGAQEFFVPKANIGLSIGGPYEVYFDPADEEKSTKGMKVLSYAPREMLSFGWTAPTALPMVHAGGTWVVVQFSVASAESTRVVISHYGWGEGAQWDAEYAHFVRGWSDLLGRLKARVANGPIDWENEFAPVDQRRKDGFSLKERKSN